MSAPAARRLWLAVSALALLVASLAVARAPAVRRLDRAAPAAVEART